MAKNIIRSGNAIFIPARGVYNGAPGKKIYVVKFHGLSKPWTMEFNDKILPTIYNENEIKNQASYAIWDETNKIYSIIIPATGVTRPIHISRHE